MSLRHLIALLALVAHARAQSGGFISVRQADGTFKRVAIPGAPAKPAPVRAPTPREQAVARFQALVQAEVDDVLAAHAMKPTSANRAMVVDAAERIGRNTGATLVELLACAKTVGAGRTGATVEESMRRCGALIRVQKKRASRK